MARRTFLFDLRICQAHSERGIPTYAQNLVLQFCRDNPGERHLFWRQPGRDLPSRHRELSALGEWRHEAELAASLDERIDVLVTTGFFGMSLQDRGKEFLCPAWLRLHAPFRLGVVYDLIPLRFPDHYLGDWRAERDYRHGVELLRAYDRLLAISEATRRDVIRLLGVDPARIQSIPGDIDDAKRLLLQSPSDDGIPLRHGLADPYFIYVGGMDWRKNHEGLIREFGRFAAHRPDWTLAIVCAMPDKLRQAHLRLALECGIRPGRLVCTGLVGDGELIALLRHARAMVFPSLYEGLGLPILEAYAAGIPVLGSDNSSIRELVHPSCRFDPLEAGAMERTLEAFVADPALGPESLEHGRAALARLGWDKSAAIASACLRPLAGAPAAPGRPRIAVAGCLPPAESGIARYTLRSFQSDRWTTDFFADLPLEMQKDPCGHPGLRPGNRVLPSVAVPLALRTEGYSGAVFVLGNSSHNLGALDSLLASRAQEGPARWVYLHEADLTGLWHAHLSRDWKRVHRFLRLHDGGRRSFWPRLSPFRPGASAKPMGVRPLVELARPDGILVNSRSCRDLVRRDLGADHASLPVEVLFLPVDGSPPVPATRGEALKVGHFGVLGRAKHPELLIQAMQILSRKRPVSLTFAGFGVQRHGVQLGFDRFPFIRILNSPGVEELQAEMARVDVAVQLRYPTQGESSAVVLELIGMGKPVVVTDAGSYSELPDPLVVKVPAQTRAGELAEAIERAAILSADPGPRRDFLEASSWDAFARRLLESLSLAQAGG